MSNENNIYRASPLRVLDILLGRTPTTAKVVMQCPQIPRTPLASLSTLPPRLRPGHTLGPMPPHSSNGSRASSLHKITTEILSAQHTLQRGLGLELVLHHHTNPRYDSTEVIEVWRWRSLCVMIRKHVWSGAHSGITWPKLFLGGYRWLLSDIWADTQLLWNQNSSCQLWSNQQLNATKPNLSVCPGVDG